MGREKARFPIDRAPCGVTAGKAAPFLCALEREGGEHALDARLRPQATDSTLTWGDLVIHHIAGKGAGRSAMAGRAGPLLLSC